MSKAKIVPSSITVRTPMPLPKRRGVSGTTEPHGALIRTRITRSDRLAIEAGARLVGMSKSAFIRFCAVECAVKLLQGSDTNDGAGASAVGREEDD